MRTTHLISALASAVVLGAVVGSSAYGQIAGSAHDMTAAAGYTGGTTTQDNGEICVYCHTPHGASAAAPLWNKPAISTTFNNYASITMDGSYAGGQTGAAAGSVSLACLSCHDGSQARDSVINMPGRFAEQPAGNSMSTLGVMSGFAAVGADDLTNDHPVGVQYAGGGYSTTSVNGPGADVDFNLAETAVIAGTQRWWVNPGATIASAAADGRDKTDMILYTRTDLGATEPFVECGSCHDPHNTSTDLDTAGAVNRQVAFLRTDNSGSAICLTCHAK